MFQILSKRELAQGTVIANEIVAAKIASHAKPGQFVIIKANEIGERIPLTIADINPQRGSITIVYQVVGKTTAFLRDLNKNDYIRDIVGPLGKPTFIEKKGCIICVGGGTGTAVLHPIARAFKKVGNKVIAIIGARTKKMLIMENEMRVASDELYICTDDGSYGYQGFVTSLFKEQLVKLGSEVKEAVCIGPLPMMKFCSNITKEFKIPTIVSLNAIMLDGTGMCGCCRVVIDGEVKFACVDGPEFDAHQVDFDSLSLRLVAYQEQEQISMAAYKQKCSCKIKV